MNFLELAKTRYSCRRFTDRKVEDEKIQKIMEAANAAPTARNVQPFHLWVIRSEEGRQKVNQTTSYGFGAGTYIVLGANPETAFLREQDEKNYADIDAAIVGTHILLQIQDLGLGTTWVGKFDPYKMKELFPEMNGYDLIALYPVGYPAEEEAAGRPTKRHFERKDAAEIYDVL